MHATPSLDALVGRLRGDVVSGAAVVARSAAQVYGAALATTSARSAEELGRHLADVSVRILDAQPAMAPLVSLACSVLEALARADSLEDARGAAGDAVAEFSRRLDALVEGSAARVAALLPEGGTVMTISYSSTVRASILAWAGSRRGGAICLEGRPMGEGRTLAADLAGRGVPATVAVDAAAASLAPACDAVLLGADSIGDQGAVNKIGSVALAQAAGRAGRPVYVVADGTKLLPAGWPQLLADDRPGEEVWRAPEGVRVWNRYFEPVPLDLVTAVVTEAAVLSPKEVEEARAGLQVPDALRAWADRRARERPAVGPEPARGRNAPAETG